MQSKFRTIAALGVLIASQLPLLAHAGPAEDARAAFSKFFPAFVARNHAEVAAMFAPELQCTQLTSPPVRDELNAP